MKKCKPVTQINQLVGGQMYISVSYFAEKLSISYFKTYGQPFMCNLSDGTSSWLLILGRYYQGYEYLNNYPPKMYDIPVGSKTYNHESRLFRFTGHNDRLLKKIVAENDHKAYRELINFS